MIELAYQCRNLTHFKLGDNVLKETFFKKLEYFFLRKNNLRKLILSRCQTKLTFDFSNSLARSLCSKFCHLEVINLSYSIIKSEFALIIFKAIHKNTSIRKARFINCNFGSHFFHDLLKFYIEHRIERFDSRKLLIDLSWNRINLKSKLNFKPILMDFFLIYSQIKIDLSVNTEIHNDHSFDQMILSKNLIPPPFKTN